MEYRDYDTIKLPRQGRRGGRWQRILLEFMNSGAVRRDIYKFDGKDTAFTVYRAFRQSVSKEPFKGKITVVKDGQVVTLNRVG